MSASACSSDQRQQSDLRSVVCSLLTLLTLLGVGSDGDADGAIGLLEQVGRELLNVRCSHLLVLLRGIEQILIAAAKHSVLAERVRFAVDGRQCTPEICERLAPGPIQFLGAHAFAYELVDFGVKLRLG